MNFSKSRHIFIPVFLVALFWVFNAGPTLSEEEAADPKAVIEAFFEAFNKHDMEAILAVYGEDVTLLSSGFEGEKRGHEGVREIYSGMFQEIPDVFDDLTTVIVEGDKAAVEFIASWAQPLPGEEGKMGRGYLKISTFFVISRGKIVEDITYFNPATVTVKTE